MKIESIMFCGDPHGRFDHIVYAGEREPTVPLILLGDMDPQRALREELETVRQQTWFIHGNHDADRDVVWNRVWGSPMAERNLHGKVVALPDGTRVAGLGGVFREAVWYPTSSAARGGQPAYRTRAEHARATPRQDRWQGGVHRRHWATIYPEDIDELADQRADVLVTHEAPGYHPNGFEIIDTLAQAMGVKLVVHGHHHDRLDSSGRWASQGFASHGVGLRGITAINGSGIAWMARAGELDEQRKHRGAFCR